MMKLSPSALEDYVQCPLQFYFKRILGLRERDEVIAETEERADGTLVHDALQNFYKKFPEPDRSSSPGRKSWTPN